MQLLVKSLDMYSRDIEVENFSYTVNVTDTLQITIMYQKNIWFYSTLNKGITDAE